MTAKQQAILDIKEELENTGKAFIAFHKELDAPIQEIVKEQLKAQRKLK